MTDRFLTLTQVGEILNVSHDHVRNLCLAGKIEYAEMGEKTWRIRESSLKDYINAVTKKPEEKTDQEELPSRSMESN